MLVQALRWRTVLLPLIRVSVVRVFMANSIGLLVNNILPFRLGEYVRTLVVAGEDRALSKSLLMASVLAERFIFDLGMLTIIVTLSIAFTPISWSFKPTIFAVITLVCLTALMLLIAIASATPMTATALVALLRPIIPIKRYARLHRTIFDLAQHLFLLRRHAGTLRLVFQTFLIWALMAMSIFCLFKSFAFVLPFTASIVFLAAVVLAMFLPSLPGHIGTYHLAAVLTLTAYGISNANGRAFAIMIHLVQFVPTTIIGAVCLFRLNLKIGVLIKKATRDPAAEK